MLTKLYTRPICVLLYFLGLCGFEYELDCSEAELIHLLFNSWSNYGLCKDESALTNKVLKVTVLF